MDQKLEVSVVQGEGAGNVLSLRKIGDDESESPMWQEGKVDELLKSLEKKMESNREKIEARNRSRREWRFPVIYSITDEIREPNKDPYSPTTVSIGPLHRRNERLKIMEADKLMYMQSLFGRSEERWLDVQRECVIEMLKMERDARGCYAEAQPEVMLVGREVEFAEMMLIDSCFIIELVCRAYLRRSYRKDSLVLENQSWDPILDNDFLSLAVKHDLIRLENQIPLCLLQQLYTMAVESRPGSIIGPLPSLFTCLLSFFGDMIGFKENKMQFRRHSYIEPTHILHLLHDCYWPQRKIEEKEKEKKEKEKEKEKEKTEYKMKESFCGLVHHVVEIIRREEEEEEEEDDEDEEMNWSWEKEVDMKMKMEMERKLHKGEEWKKFKYSATQLDLAGVKFHRGSHTNLFNIRFRRAHFWLQRGQLEIPPFRITCSTEPLLKNLIAFEQTCPLTKRYFTSHAFLMDKLINSAQDVDLLVKAGVVHNYLGSSEDASLLYNNICNHVVVSDFFFHQPCRLVNQHCNRFGPRCLVKLKRDYFSSPWSIIAVAAAISLFALALLQTIFTLLSYYNPR